jgi:hypothetical protein
MKTGCPAGKIDFRILVLAKLKKIKKLNMIIGITTSS